MKHNNINQNIENREKEMKKELKSNENYIKEYKELNKNVNNKIEKGLDNNIKENNINEEITEEPIYVMTLALEQGKSEKIEIFSNSDPTELAYNFCSKNNLDYDALDYLKEQITNLLESYAKNENYEDYINNNENECINEIEEVKEDQEFNITENYKENLNSQITTESINKENSDYKNYKEEINSKEYEDYRNKNEINNDIKNDINEEKNNKIINNNAGGYFIKKNNKTKEEITNLQRIKNDELFSNDKNRSKRRNYKINEDIIIGIGDYNNNKDNKINNISGKNDKEEIKSYKNITNNFNQETKTNTNNNIIQNDEEEKTYLYSPKNEQNIYNNIKNKNLLKEEKKKNNKKINKIKPKENIYKNRSVLKSTQIKKEIDKEYSFKPMINDNYKTDLSFNERLKIFNNISRIKKEELKNSIYNLKDKESGQDFFRPKLISKNLSFIKNKKEIDDNNNMDIFNKNYLYLEKYNLKRQNLYNKYYENRGKPQFYNKIKNEKIINETNKKAFSNLFNILDSDQDDLITSVSININNIPENIYKIIEPLLIELKEDNQTLNQDEFIKAMNKLFENISFSKRRELINEYNKYNITSKTTRYNNNYKEINKKKILNKNTNKLAEKHYLKMQKMMNIYDKEYNKSFYNKTSKNNYNHFFIDNAKNNKFSSINNCTFNNYLKNLN